MKNLHVANLPYSTTEAELRSIFEVHGTIERISLTTDLDIGHSPGSGFVEMTYASQADKAILALDGTEMGGRTLKIKEAKATAGNTLLRTTAAAPTGVAISGPEGPRGRSASLRDVVRSNSPRRTSGYSRERSYPPVARRWEELARMVVAEDDPERLTILLAYLDLALLPGLEFADVTSTVRHTARVHEIETRLFSHDRGHGGNLDCADSEQRNGIRVEPRKGGGTPNLLGPNLHGDDDGFLILREGRSTVPSLAACTRCQLKFFTPRSLMDAPFGAVQYLLSKFAAHDCALPATNAKKERIGSES